MTTQTLTPTTAPASTSARLAALMEASRLPPELRAFTDRIRNELSATQRDERIVRENRDFLFGRFLFE